MYVPPCKPDAGFVFLSVLQLISFVLVLNHLIACAWYYVGKHVADQGRTSWIKAARRDEPRESHYYLYLTSLHWSLTQFTPAAMKYSATNSEERLFSIIVLFFALVVFSSFVGSITNSITRLRSLRIDSSKQLWFLRRFLREQDVSVNLSQRIYKFVEHKLWQERGQIQIHASDVNRQLSSALSDELAFDMHSKALCVHNFFACLSTEMEVVMHRICRVAMRVQNAAKEELVFSAGDEGKFMYFAQSGLLDYTAVNKSDSCYCGVRLESRINSNFQDPNWEYVRWIAEAVLWVAWRHRGKLVVGANEPSALIVVDPKAFFDLMSKHPRSWLYAVAYGERFVNYLNRLDKLTDVMINDEFYSEASTTAIWLATHPWAADMTESEVRDARDAGSNMEKEGPERVGDEEDADPTNKVGASTSQQSL